MKKNDKWEGWVSDLGNNQTIHLFTWKIVSFFLWWQQQQSLRFNFVSRLVLHQFITSLERRERIRKTKSGVKGWAVIHIIQHTPFDYYSSDGWCLMHGTCFQNAVIMTACLPLLRTTCSRLHEKKKWNFWFFEFFQNRRKRADTSKFFPFFLLFFLQEAINQYLKDKKGIQTNNR
jgi:hypothetical protein